MSTRKNGVKLGTLAAAGVGLLLSSLLLLLLTGLMSVIAFCTKNPLMWVKPLSIAALIICAAVCGFVTARVRGEGSFGVVMLSSLMLVLVLFIISIIASGGHMSVGSLINYICYMATAAVFAFLGGRAPKRRTRRKYR